MQTLTLRTPILKAAEERLRRLQAGWKLHLNFNATDSSRRDAIEDYLSELQADGLITSYKIGHGGGVDSDAPGKEATVYVGPKDTASMVSKMINEALYDLLADPEGDTLIDDTPFEAKVVGRFDIGRADLDFHQYGPRGVPLLNDDVSASLWGGDFDEEKARQKADALLKARYGDFYTGSEK